MQCSMYINVCCLNKCLHVCLVCVVNSYCRVYFSFQVGNKLVISRTFNTDDTEFVRTEVVTNPAVIDAYMKIAGNKQLK